MNTAVLSDSHHDTEREHETNEPEYSGILPLPRLTPGHCISDKYLIRGVLGTGGFAVVYEAEHLGLQCVMAIKVLHVNEHTPETLIARFREEARISAVVHHLNVLDVHDTGTLEDGSPYLVMERIHGETLHARMSRGLLPIHEVVEVARQLLNALGMLNERGIVHRDIKPENLMLHTSRSGERIVKLVDFGISKMGMRSTIDGGVIGTPHYMSPEHLSGEEVTVQSDLYAAGVVLYEALAGQVPFDGTNLNALVFAVLHCDVPALRVLRPDCPPELERIVCTAMNRDRTVRYASPEAMLADVEELARALRTPGHAQPTLAYAEPRAIRADLSGDKPSGVDGSDYGVAPQVWTSLATSIAPDHVIPSRRSRVGRALLLSAACLFFAALGPRLEPASTSPTASASGLTQTSALPSFDPKQEHTIGNFHPELVAASATGPELFAGVALEPASVGDAQGPHKQRVQKEHAETSPPAKAHLERVRAARVSAMPLAGHAGEAQDGKLAENLHGNLLSAALANYVRGRHTEAHLLYRRATTLDPSAPQAWRGLGIVAARVGNKSEARSALERYLVLKPGASDAEAIRKRLKELR